MLFEFFLVTEQFLIQSRHEFFKRSEMFALRIHGIFIHRCGRTDACHHIFALRIHQVFAIEFIFTCSRVTGKSNTGAAVITHIAKHHSLHVHCCAPFIGYLFYTTVFHGPLAIPTAEHGADTAPHLFPGFFGKWFPQQFLYRFFIFIHQFFQLINRQFRITFISAAMFDMIELFIKYLPDALSMFHFNTCRFFHHHIGIHHDQPAISVISESLIPALGNDALDRFIIQSNIQHGFHHTRHTFTGSRPDRYQQRVI